MSILKGQGTVFIGLVFLDIAREISVTIIALEIICA